MMLLLLQLHVLPVQVIQVVARLRRAIVHGYRETRHVERRAVACRCLRKLGAPSSGRHLPGRSARFNPIGWPIADRRSGPVTDRRAIERSRARVHGIISLSLPLLYFCRFYSLLSFSSFFLSLSFSPARVRETARRGCVAEPRRMLRRSLLFSLRRGTRSPNSRSDYSGRYPAPAYYADVREWGWWIGEPFNRCFVYRGTKRRS